MVNCFCDASAESALVEGLSHRISRPVRALTRKIEA